MLWLRQISNSVLRLFISSFVFINIYEIARKFQVSFYLVIYKRKSLLFYNSILHFSNFLNLQKVIENELHRFCVFLQCLKDEFSCFVTITRLCLAKTIVNRMYSHYVDY